MSSGWLTAPPEPLGGPSVTPPQVIAISPFRLPSLNFLSTGAKTRQDDGEEFKGWHVLTKPVSSQQLLFTLDNALSAQHRDLASLGIGLQHRKPTGPARTIALECSLRHTAIGQLARHPNIKQLPIRVLVVDDMPVKQNLVRWIAESHGMQCDRAMDGFECVQAVEMSDYDVHAPTLTPTYPSSYPLNSSTCRAALKPPAVWL